MKNFLVILLLFPGFSITAQPLSKTFEMRYFTSDPKANGETDFKGETEWMDTEQRIAFLNKYADFAASYYGNQSLDKKIVSDDDIRKLISSIKPQPLTNFRKTIPLNGWKAHGYKRGQDELKKNELANWTSSPGATISEGELNLDNTALSRDIDTLNWKFKLECKIKTVDKGALTLKLSNGENTAFLITFSNGRLTSNVERKSNAVSMDQEGWYNLLVEGDFTQKRFNLYVNDKLIYDFVHMPDTNINALTVFSLVSSGKTIIDDLFIFNHKPTGVVNHPYISNVVIDENFEEKPDIEGWQNLQFNDKHWKTADLPAVHGGIREKEEDFYLRKKIRIDDFQRGVLTLETLDPGGEVWINNEVVAVIKNRHPYEFDVTKYLIPNQENIIAVRVKPYQVTNRMGHTPTDHHIGWFLGRTKLVLSSECMINDVKVTTKEISSDAVQLHAITLQYPRSDYFDGILEVNYYPWFPEDGELVASASQEVKIYPRIENEFTIQMSIQDPRFWHADTPHLYKVEVILKDKEGNPVDDYVTTTGIRTVEQKIGNLYINGKQEMLNGAQIMGYRTPIETISKHNRCAPIETVAEEMLMIRNMDANLLRIHVHSESGKSDGINDPRYAEFADQMGIYLIWSTAAWVRSSHPWDIDFEGYPKYMNQVFNHPSIVIWEASNHPTRFKDYDISVTHNFIRKIYHTIHNDDQSRLITPTTFFQHTHYANYDGTIDYQGNPITPVPEFNAPLVTRGGQDAYSGYGADWSKIRTAPNNWAGSCLAANDKAYFNFEHEESIGQPNWSLSKGKPWYLIHSYEWDYDVGSIGRRLTSDEWRASQAWQAFAAWESMKKQILLGYDGFSWCSLRGGPNMGTYQKPLIDNLRHPKLAYYANKMVFQKIWAASNNVDVIYGPEDKIIPVIQHYGSDQRVDLLIELKDLKGKVLDRKFYRNVEIREGISAKEFDGFRFRTVADGIYTVHYSLLTAKL